MDHNLQWFDQWMFTAASKATADARK